MAKKRKNKGVAGIIIFVVVVMVLAVALSVLSKLNKRVEKNVPGTVGNTAGNIYNKGLFCEDDGYIYFSNSYDYGSLYSMTEDEQNVKRLIAGKIEYINAGGNYLYYYMADSKASTGLGYLRRVMGIYRCKKNGKAFATISRNPSLEMILINDSIYYQNYDKTHGVHLSKINTDGSHAEDLSLSIINPAGVYNDVIYFSNQEDNHFLMLLDTVNDSITEYARINMWNPIRMGNYIYYMNIDGDYNLCRYNINDETVDVLTKDRVDTFNLNTDYIFYQKNDAENPCLKRMSIDGSYEEIIAEGNYKNINVTDRYVYFQPFENDIQTLRTPAYGSINVTEFSAAKEAAFEN